MHKIDDEDINGDNQGDGGFWVGPSAYRDSCGDLYGKQLAALGDINGDSRSELLVAAPRYSVHGTGYFGGRLFIHSGAVYIYSGNDLLTDYVDYRLRILGNEVGADFGSFLAPAGDLNADLKTDLFIGSPKADGIGSVHLFSAPLP